MEEADLREVAGQPLDLDEHAAGLAVQVRALDRDLDVGPLALAEVADRVVAVLRRREQHAVVASAAVVAAVVDVGVEAVLVDGPIEHAQAHLLRRAEGARDVTPAGCGGRLSLREGALPAKPAGWSNCSPKDRGESLGVGRGYVVRRHAAARAEVAEVERRAVDGAAASARPTRSGRPSCRRARRTGRASRPGARPASNAAVRLPNGWPFTWKVLLVEPCTPGQAPVFSVNQPAPVFGGACVSRPLPDARAPLRSRSRKPGTTPWPAYFSTASWRRPSEAKKRSLSSRPLSWPWRPLPTAPVRPGSACAQRDQHAAATSALRARLDTTFLIPRPPSIVRPVVRGRNLRLSRPRGCYRDEAGALPPARGFVRTTLRVASGNARARRASRYAHFPHIARRLRRRRAAARRERLRRLDELQERLRDRGARQRRSWGRLRRIPRASRSTG